MKYESTCITKSLVVYTFNNWYEALFQSYVLGSFLATNFGRKDFKSLVGSPSMNWSATFKKPKHVICLNNIF